MNGTKPVKTNSYQRMSGNQLVTKRPLSHKMDTPGILASKGHSRGFTGNHHIIFQAPGVVCPLPGTKVNRF